VKVRAECAGGRVERLEFENVPSFAAALDAPVEVPDVGSLRVDVAYGGAFAAFVDAAALGFSVTADEARELAELGERIRPHVAEQVEIAHPTAPDHLSFVVLVGPGRDGADARQATVVSPGRLDRSPTGTATSARMAVLDARGALGERYVAESVLGTRFVGRVASRTRDAIVPAISGRACITGFHQLVVDPGDPLADGFKLPDTWGPGLADGLLNRAPRPPSR
jgi:proline racemase